MGSRGAISHGGSLINGTLGRDPMLSRFRTFGSQMEAINYHLQNNFDQDKWDHALDAMERQGIYDYTDYHYSRINTDLREGLTPNLDTERRINGATSGLSKFEASEDVITFRGSNYHWTANLLGGTEQQLSDPRFLRSRIGKTVTDKGFMSSGTHMDSAWSADVTYKIYVNKGIKGMYVDPISANSGEYEFLFNRDTSFIVHMIKTNSSGRPYEMVLEAVRSKH